MKLNPNLFLERKYTEFKEQKDSPVYVNENTWPASINVQDVIGNISQQALEAKEKFTKIDRQLLIYNTSLLMTLPQKDTFRDIGSFINKNIAWFRAKSDHGKMIGESGTTKLTEHLKTMQHTLQNIRKVTMRPPDDLLDKLENLIARIVPKQSLPDDVLKTVVFKHLPANDPVSIFESVDIIKTKIKVKTVAGYKPLADWVSFHQIPLETLEFTTQELYLLAPNLTHVSIGNIDTWQDANYQFFLTRCKKMTSLSIHTDRIKSLPAMARQLIHLDCQACGQLCKLPDDMHLLQSLICNDCPALPALPAGMQSLRVLECSLCMGLDNIPADMPHLQQLNCVGCTALRDISASLTNLQKVDCRLCPVLSISPKLRNQLKELLVS